MKKCSVSDCEDKAVITANISIDSQPRKKLPVCQRHADSVKEDKPQRILRVNAKCSDLCWMAVDQKDGKRVGEYDGDVPAWFPNPTTTHYGDYVELNIDLETGQIIGWKKPTEAQLKATFKVEVNA